MALSDAVLQQVLDRAQKDPDFAKLLQESPLDALAQEYPALSEEGLAQFLNYPQELPAYPVADLQQLHYSLRIAGVARCQSIDSKGWSTRFSRLESTRC